MNIALRRRAAPIPLSFQEIIDCLSPRFSLRRRPPQTDPPRPYVFEERRVLRGIYLVPRRTVYSYIKNYGVCLAEDYPFLGRRGQRREPAEGVMRVQIQGWREIPPGTSHSVIKRIIDREGTITASVQTFASFSDYRRGIYTGRAGETDAPLCKHAIVVTGYGRKNHGLLAGTEFYRIKNSGGLAWGKGGRGKIECSLHVIRLHISNYCRELDLRDPIIDGENGMLLLI